MWWDRIFRKDLCHGTGRGFELKGYRRIPGGWVSSNISEIEKGNEIWKGAVFKERGADPFSTTGIETQIIRAKLRHFLVNYGVTKSAIVMDAGCADGRVTHLLLEAGMRRLVSVDLDRGNVDRLVRSLEGVYRRRVLVIVDDLNHLPLADRTVDVLVSSALFAEMPDFGRGLQTAMRILKPGGFLFYFDPVLEHALIYALIRHDLEEFLQVARTFTRARMWEQKNQRYRVYPAHELDKQLLSNPELEILEKDGISILPSLIFGGILQEIGTDAERKQELRDMILSLSEEHLQIHRQILYICRKKE